MTNIFVNPFCNGNVSRKNAGNRVENNGRRDAANHESTMTMRIPARVVMGIMMWLFVFFAMPKANAQFSGGNGTEGNPYIITTAAQLAQLARM
jgi:hypothetical protein